MISFAQAVGDGVVARAVVELVMIFIVSWRPCKSRKAVEEGNPIIGDVVQRIRFPHWNVILIMRYNSHSHRKVKRSEIEEHIETNAPLYKQYRSGK